MIECVIPILRVQSVAASVAFYVRSLGFRVDWEGENNAAASVSRDGFSIMFVDKAQGNAGTWVWIGVEDVEQLFGEFQSRGVTFRRTPTNFEWAYEMSIVDPDGHVLRFGSDPKSDRPIDHGEI